VHAPGRGKGARRPRQHPLRSPGARRAPTAGTTGTGAARRAEGSASVSFAAACLHRCKPDGWRAPRGSPGDRVGGGRRPGRQSSVGRGAARGPGRGRHEDAEVAPRAEAGADGRRGSPRPPVHRWVPGTSGRCSRTFPREPGSAGTGRRGTCGTRSSLYQFFRRRRSSRGDRPSRRLPADQHDGTRAARRGRGSPVLRAASASAPARMAPRPASKAPSRGSRSSFPAWRDDRRGKPLRERRRHPGVLTGDDHCRMVPSGVLQLDVAGQQLTAECLG
jgi:hypothetical protein